MRVWEAEEHLRDLEGGGRRPLVLLVLAERLQRRTFAFPKKLVKYFIAFVRTTAQFAYWRRMCVSERRGHPGCIVCAPGPDAAA